MWFFSKAQAIAVASPQWVHISTLNWYKTCCLQIQYTIPWDNTLEPSWWGMCSASVIAGSPYLFVPVWGQAGYSVGFKSDNPLSY